MESINLVWETPVRRRVVRLNAEQRSQLVDLRDHAPKAYLRERAAAILKIADGQSARSVALNGLLKPRDPETVCGWVDRYLQEGIEGLHIRPGRGRKPVFRPRDIDTARDEVELVLRRAPWHYGVPRSRWRLQDLRRVIAWLGGVSDSGIYKVLKRLGFSRKQALNFVRSPDPEFRAKWEAILRAYQEALEHPDEVVFLFQDEHSYYRDPTKAPAWHRKGKTQPRAWGKPGYNKRTRIGAAVNALTGQVIYLQRDEMGVEGLSALYARIRETYPHARVIYLVQDNWPVHKLPQVGAAREREGLTALFLPTYATWLNPIEKLWRWLKQEVLHVHPFVGDLAHLRKKAQEFLERFTRGSSELLHYLGWPRIIATVTRFVTGLIC
jgi:transposase